MHENKVPDSSQVHPQPFDTQELEKIRAQFPILSTLGRSGRRLVYLDWAATAQKPQVVLDTIDDFYQKRNGAVHRGTHLLADQSSEIFEDARHRVASFIGADEEEIVWTKNSTEGFNLLAYAFGNPPLDGSAALIGRGDKIVVTRAEHHANLVPWIQLAQRTGATLDWLDLDEDAQIDLNTLDRITKQTKIVAFTHASNVSGAISPVTQIVQAAKTVGALTVCDICQSVAHTPLDVHQMGIDFAAFSGHKMLGPTGIGALWGRRELLAELPPFLGGGSMIADVEMDHFTVQELPYRFEAGTQPVAQIAGWARALDFLADLGMDRIAAHENALTSYLLQSLEKLPRLRILGPKQARNRIGLVAFEIPGVHPHDVGQLVDAKDVAIRVGHHCALPLHKFFGLRSSSRASLGLTSTTQDIDRLIEGLEYVEKYFGQTRNGKS